MNHLETKVKLTAFNSLVDLIERGINPINEEGKMYIRQTRNIFKGVIGKTQLVIQGKEHYETLPNLKMILEFFGYSFQDSRLKDQTTESTNAIKEIREYIELLDILERSPQTIYTNPNVKKPLLQLCYKMQSF